VESRVDSNQRFEERRPYLRSVAFRILGSVAEAEDAVQETWLRLNRSSGEQIDNFEGWTTTVVTRICLDILRRRKTQAEERLDAENTLESIRSGRFDPEQEAEMAEAVGIALLVVLNTLAPPERIAFVLHDMFAFAFEEIAIVLERTPASVRQLASRARRRVQGAPHQSPRNLKDQKVISSFLTYLRAGDINGVMSVLHPDVIRSADAAAVPPPGEQLIIGKSKVAQEAATRASRAKFCQMALINGDVGIVVAPQGRLVMALLFIVANGQIVEFNVIAEPKQLAAFEIRVLPRSITQSSLRWRSLTCRIFPTC
jgi:RNA polymerase sigma factor (sigma-70 family)